MWKRRSQHQLNQQQSSAAGALEPSAPQAQEEEATTLSPGPEADASALVEGVDAATGPLSVNDADASSSPPPPPQASETEDESGAQQQHHCGVAATSGPGLLPVPRLAIGGGEVTTTEGEPRRPHSGRQASRAGGGSARGSGRVSAVGSRSATTNGGCAAAAMPPLNVVCDFKVVLTGSAGSGKTSIANRYVKGDDFRDVVPPTIGVSYLAKKEPVLAAATAAGAPAPAGVAQAAAVPPISVVELQLWDTAGQEQFHALVPMYYRQSAAVIIVTDATNPLAAHEVTSWVEKARMNAPETALVALCLNKTDLPDTDRAVSIDVLEQVAKAHQLMFFCVSAKSGKGVAEMFSSVANGCYERHRQQEERRAATATTSASGGATNRQAAAGGTRTVSLLNTSNPDDASSHPSEGGTNGSHPLRKKPCGGGCKN